MNHDRDATAHPGAPDAGTTPARRHFLSIPLIIERVAPDEGRGTFFGYAKNISHGGMFISTSSPRELGKHYELAIPLPRPLERTVHCVCEVVWRRPWSGKTTLEPGMGLRFLDLDPADREAIDQWVEEAWQAESRIGRPLLEGFRDRGHSDRSPSGQARGVAPGAEGA